MPVALCNDARAIDNSVALVAHLCHAKLFFGNTWGCFLQQVGLVRRSLAAAAIAIASPAIAAISADPAGSGVIVGAVNWLQGTLLGTVATVVAVIAVAAVGFMMLTGRVNWRHGAVVILGCFILFGAASIVAGIRAAATGG